MMVQEFRPAGTFTIPQTQSSRQFPSHALIKNYQLSLLACSAQTKDKNVKEFLFCKSEKESVKWTIKFSGKEKT